MIFLFTKPLADKNFCPSYGFILLAVDFYNQVLGHWKIAIFLAILWYISSEGKLRSEFENPEIKIQDECEKFGFQNHVLH